MVEKPNLVLIITDQERSPMHYFHAEGSFPAESEMYDLVADPDELENLAHPDHPRYSDPEVAAERQRLQSKLAELEDELARPVPA